MTTWRVTSPGVSGPPIPSIVEHRTFCPFFPCLVAMVGLICPVLCFGIMLAKEAEDVRDRSRLLGLSFFVCIIVVLGGLDSPPHGEPEAPTELQVLPLAAGPALCHPWCHLSLPCQQPGPSPPPWVEGGLPSNTDHCSHHPLPQRDVTFFLDCLY